MNQENDFIELFKESYILFLKSVKSETIVNVSLSLANPKYNNNKEFLKNITHDDADIFKNKYENFIKSVQEKRNDLAISKYAEMMAAFKKIIKNDKSIQKINIVNKIIQNNDKLILLLHEKVDYHLKWVPFDLTNDDKFYKQDWIEEEKKWNNKKYTKRTIIDKKSIFNTLISSKKYKILISTYAEVREDLSKMQIYDEKHIIDTLKEFDDNTKKTLEEIINKNNSKSINSFFKLLSETKMDTTLSRNIYINVYHILAYRYILILEHKQNISNKQKDKKYQIFYKLIPEESYIKDYLLTKYASKKLLLEKLFAINTNKIKNKFSYHDEDIFPEYKHLKKRKNKIKELEENIKIFRECYNKVYNSYLTQNTIGGKHRN